MSFSAARRPILCWVLFAGLALSLAALSCGGKGSRETTEATFEDTRGAPEARAAAVTRETKAVLQGLSMATAALLRSDERHRRLALAELLTIERLARRLGQQARALPQNEAARAPLIMVNGTAARAASKLREIVRLVEEGRAREARSRARDTAEQLRRMTDQLQDHFARSAG